MTTSNPEEIQPGEGGEPILPHRGKLIFLLGILGIFPFGLLAGIPAFLLGKADLAKMDQGVMDGAGRNPTNLGRTLGLVSVGWTVVVVLVLALFGARLFGSQQEAATPRGARRAGAAAGAKGVVTSPARSPGAAVPAAGLASGAAGPNAAMRGNPLGQAQAAPTPSAVAPSAAALAASATLVSGGMPIGPDGVYGGAREPNRPDPFLSQPAPPMPKPKPPTPNLPPIYNVPVGIRVQQTNARQASLRRTAGLVWNGNVYGLLELGGEIYIVRPGDKVANYTVSAITREAIVLYSSDLKKYIEVPLEGPGAERQETESGGAPITAINNLQAQPAAGNRSESPESATPSGGFGPALPGLTPGY
jgi:hypothetical protein